MRIKSKPLRIALKIAGGIVVALVVCAINWKLDWKLYDFLYEKKGKRSPNPEIVIITVDDYTLKKADKLWPLGADVYSEFLSKICSENPSVVAFDIEFDYDLGSSRDYQGMGEIIKRKSCKTVWGRGFIEQGNELKTIPAELPNYDSAVFNDFRAEGRSSKSYRQFVRTAAPHWRNGFEWLKSLAFKTTEIHTGEELEQDNYKYYLFWIDYAGPAGTYKHIPLYDVLEGKYKKGFFKGKIVLVGRGEADHYPNYLRTPYYKRKNVVDMLRVEIHANIVDTVLNKRKIFVADPYIGYFLTIILSVITVFILFGTSPLVGIVIVFSQFVGLLLMGLISLKMQYYISTIEPLFGVFISYYLLIPYRLVSEYRSRWEYQQAHKILSEVEIMKSNFLSLITHDLKTPIARVHGIAESMLKEAFDKLNEEERKSLKAIMKNSDELNNFISRIIKLAQIEASKVKLNLESKDINALIEESLEHFTFFLKEKEIDLEKKLEPMFSTKMDVQLIAQVLYNLFDNAIKYSSHKSKITVSSLEEGGFVKVVVRDEGIGISQAHLKRMFSKFYRVKDERTTNVKGSGLGLYLVKYFVELHGGQISVESEPEKGSTFTFSLPIA